MLQFHNVVGIIRVLRVLLAYFLIQTGRLSADILSYSILNGLGSSLILFSPAPECGHPGAAQELYSLQRQAPVSR